jgi:hypothetical protein
VPPIFAECELKSQLASDEPGLVLLGRSAVDRNYLLQGHNVGIDLAKDVRYPLRADL